MAFGKMAFGKMAFGKMGGHGHAPYHFQMDAAAEGDKQSMTTHPYLFKMVKKRDLGRGESKFQEFGLRNV